MSKTFQGKQLVIGVIYNPPEGSPYADPTVFDFIEETIADIKGKDESTDICLMGDFNARTANLSDIMDNDEDLDFLNITADAYIPALRTNMDCHVYNSDNHSKQSTRRRKETHRPWYSAECETKRHKYTKGHPLNL